MKAYSFMLIFFTTPLFSAEEPTQIGRYQLISGPDPNNLPQQALYRVDTQTGKVWRLDSFKVSAAKGGSIPAEGWTGVSENLGAAIHFASLAGGADPASLTNRWSTTNQMELELKQAYWPPLMRETYDKALRSELWTREDAQGKNMTTNSALRSTFFPHELEPYRFLARTNKIPESKKQ